jgi:hypothetical protein
VVRKFLAASPSEQIASTKQAALSELTANAEKLGLYEASTQQAEPSLRKQLQRRCSEWGAYWRASDSHGVELTSAQAVELLEEALGVEVEIEQAEPAQAAVPHPGSPEASAMMDSVLAEYNWPTNTKNAARAGYVAAARLMGVSWGVKLEGGE